MSRVDDVFARVPGRLFNDWGEDITYVKTVTPRVYEPDTGRVIGADKEVTIKGVITRLTPRESEGLYQTTDVKILFGTEALGDYYPTEADRLRYNQAGVKREAKIINILTFRGEKAIYHEVIARPQ